MTPAPKCTVICGYYIFNLMNFSELAIIRFMCISYNKIYFAKLVPTNSSTLIVFLIVDA